MTCEIINNIPGIEDLSYLELGVYNNVNFDSIVCRTKQSVDMNGRAMFTGTTDEFFAQLDKKTRYDIVFIDANHDYEYVLRDFNNSVGICDKWIILHDMVPPDKNHTNTNLCSDGFKVLFYLKNFTNLETYTLDHNYGLTFVKMPGKKLKPSKENASLSYEIFSVFAKALKQYSYEEMVQILRGEHV